MAILSVGSGKQYQTLNAAIAASKPDDTIQVDTGLYLNDFARIDHSLTLRAVGGLVTLSATVSPPNGKAIITEGAPGISVAIDGFAFTGAAVPDANGAGIRYEGGDLTITNSYFYNNQNGILAGGDPNGTIIITHSEFAANGVGGNGSTHNIYVGDIRSFTLADSFSHDANVGHEVKSRADNTTITNNRILDNASTASYEIDIPNGGNATITGNTIQQGPNSENPTIIAYGEEGNLNPGNALLITGNTIINDLGRGPALWNATSTPAIFTGNATYGFGTTPLVSGPATQLATTVLASKPALDQSAPYATTTTVPVAPSTTAPSTTASFTTAAGATGNAALAAVAAAGPSYLQWQYIWASPEGVSIATQVPNVFLHGGPGQDALRVATGRNVLDGGTGSNYLVGGSGVDTFFTDARGTAVVWNTIDNFHAGDAATLWGFVPGLSTYHWEDAVDGAIGAKGATLRANITGGPGRSGDGIDASITFAGLTVDQAKQLNVATGTQPAGTYLYLYNPGV